MKHFAFAHKLYKELNVPIGILNCSWSSTQIAPLGRPCGNPIGVISDEVTLKIDNLDL